MADRFEEMIRAARQAPQSPREGELAARTRSAVLAKARAKAKTRSRLVTFILPIAATFIATLAWAGATGRLTAIFGVGESEPNRVPVVSTVQSGKKNEKSASVNAPLASASTNVEPLPNEEPNDNSQNNKEQTSERPQDVPQVIASAVASTNVAAPVSASVSAKNTEDELSDQLYRQAHELHFRGGSPGAAVAAWDRYIATAPRGRFVMEAQYNRALALIRAGQRNAGLDALKPFASGRYGNYRKEEAKQLLEAAGVSY